MRVSWSTLGELYIVAEWAIRVTMLMVVPFRRPPEASRSWLLLFFFLPIPALILYRLIGRPRMPGWRAERFARARVAMMQTAAALPRAEVGGLAPIATLIERLGGFAPTSGGRIAYIDKYRATIDRLVADIDAATDEVHVLAYIFADDATGRQVADALGRAAARGVRTRVLVDALGSRMWARNTLAMLEERGVAARLVLPIVWARLRRARADLRNHRKLFLIDGRIGYVGSQNIVDRDFRAGVINEELVARVEGPVVAAMAVLFAADWYLETEEQLALPPVPGPAGGATTQLMPSGPDYGLPGFERLLVALVHAAERRVVITSPYLIPDEALLAAMETAVLRGVAVEVIVSRVVDQRLVSYAQRSYYADLLRAGVVIHRYRERLLHAKHVLVDGVVGVIGSSNADIRSFMLNAEVSLILYGPDEVAALGTIQQGYVTTCDQLDAAVWRRRPWWQKLIENLARLVSPLL